MAEQSSSLAKHAIPNSQAGFTQFVFTSGVSLKDPSLSAVATRAEGALYLAQGQLRRTQSTPTGRRVPSLSPSPADRQDLVTHRCRPGVRMRTGDDRSLALASLEVPAGEEPAPPLLWLWPSKIPLSPSKANSQSVAEFTPKPL